MRKLYIYRINQQHKVKKKTKKTPPQTTTSGHYYTASEMQIIWTALKRMFPTATLYIPTEMILEDKNRKKILQKISNASVNSRILSINAATQQNTENIYFTI